MRFEMNEITVNGVTYVPKQEKSENPIFMVRSYAAGVFYGEIVSKEHQVSGLMVTMKNARRVWCWSGAASLSQLATDGTSDPKNCKFPCKVEHVELMNVCELIAMTEEAVDSLNKVSIWQK